MPSSYRLKRRTCSSGRECPKSGKKNHDSFFLIPWEIYHHETTFVDRHRAGPCLPVHPGSAQMRQQQSEEAFVKNKPTIGDPLPDLIVYDPDGKEVKTATLHGHYTVLTFGCLT